MVIHTGLRPLYHWADISEIPELTGIYAWYYRHKLTDYDIKRLIADLSQSPALSEEDANARVLSFLRTHLFEPFTEEPYAAVIRGPLKPVYEGMLYNQLSISTDLVNRIRLEPSRLWILKRVLEQALPEFASPIYIGMAQNLATRLRRHKTLIERYKAVWGKNDAIYVEPEEELDHSFARDVTRRGFSPNGLAVAVRPIETTADVHVDAENILNRINFPLCGRN